MSETAARKTYASFGIRRSWMQIRQALNDRRNADRNMQMLLRLVLQAEARMAHQLGRPIQNLRILEIGPGQGMERIRYFGLKNEVIGLDLDVIPVQHNAADYWHIFRTNGLGRMAKTLGRKIIIGSANEIAWSNAVGSGAMRAPEMHQGDICGHRVDIGRFDLVMSWSVFEHLPDPEQALKNIVQMLRPGGALYVSIHLYTAINGHHDIRAFSGLSETLPLWGHLRPGKRGEIQPSCYLNQWRLSQWRALFDRLVPGYKEFLESHDTREQGKKRITAELRQELSAYSDEELFTVDAVYCWQKPLEPDEE